MSEETQGYATGSDANGSSDAKVTPEGEATKTEGAADAETKTGAPVVEKKKSVRKPIWVAVPNNIGDVDAVDPDVPESPEADEDGKKPSVEVMQMPESYSLYVIPGGPGQKKAVDAVLKKHEVDPRNIDRVRIWSGAKPFAAEPQYNIRWI